MNDYDVELVKAMVFVIEDGHDVSINGCMVRKDGRDEQDRKVYTVEKPILESHEGKNIVVRDMKEFWGAEEAVRFFLGIDVLHANREWEK